jgi:hypothetical protein
MEDGDPAGVTAVEKLFCKFSRKLARRAVVVVVIAAVDVVAVDVVVAIDWDNDGMCMDRHTGTDDCRRGRWMTQLLVRNLVVPTKCSNIILPNVFFIAFSCKPNVGWL